MEALAHAEPDWPSRRPRVFNTAFESGMRSLILLTSCYPTWLGLSRLAALDYMLVHSGDVEGPPSLHPAEDSRAAELFVRRKLVSTGLSLLGTRGLAQRRATPHGFRYQAGDEAGSFIDLLKSPYFLDLKTRADWLAANIVSMTDEDFEVLVRGRIDQWASEFQEDRTPLV